MDETLNSVDAEQTPVVEGQTDTTEVVAGESESAVPAEQQATEVTEPAKVEPKQQTPEENAQFKALRLEERRRAEEAAERRAEDRSYENVAQVNGWTKIDGSPIRSKADYDETVKAVQERDALVLQGYTPDAAALKVENDMLKKTFAERETVAQKEQREATERQGLLQEFYELNERQMTQEDAKTLLPKIAALAVQDGIPLRYAYAKIHALEQRQKAKNLEIGKTTAEANASNAGTSTGSVTGKGQAANSVLTEESINAMTDKQRMDRWPDIKKFYNMR